MAELNFIEYNVNETTHNAEDISISLQGLGFNQISVSKNGKASMWAANKCVILLNSLNIPTGLSGIGFNSADTVDGSVYCETTGFNVAKIQDVNLYTYPIEQFKSNYDNHFTTVGTAGVESPLDYFAGVVFNCNNINIVNNINDGLKFRVVRKSPDYITSVCEHNRFNIMWNVNNDLFGMDTLVIKTDNIVDLTALLTAKGFESPAISKQQQEIISDIYKNNKNLPPKHVTNGWGLNLAGKEKSYVLEKIYPNALPNIDIIISERYNHNGLNEESIKYFENEPLSNIEQL
jgi:hypothetical protein